MAEDGSTSPSRPLPRGRSQTNTSTEESSGTSCRSPRVGGDSQSTCRFSHDLDLESLRQILCRISRAMLSESEVREPCRRLELEPRRCRFRSREARRRICLSTPTSSSSTLCWMPDEVSMYLQSREAASALPSATQEGHSDLTNHDLDSEIERYGNQFDAILSTDSI